MIIFLMMSDLSTDAKNESSLELAVGQFSRLLFLGQSCVWLGELLPLSPKFVANF